MSITRLHWLSYSSRDLKIFSSQRGIHLDDDFQDNQRMKWNVDTLPQKVDQTSVDIIIAVHLAEIIRVPYTVEIKSAALVNETSASSRAANQSLSQTPAQETLDKNSSPLVYITTMMSVP